MIRVGLYKNKIIINCSEDPVILEWEHRSFFTLAVGYEVEEHKQQYIYSNLKTLHRILLETIDYLNDEGFEYELDKFILHVLERDKSEQDEYEKALEAGKELGVKKSTPVYPVGLIRQMKEYQLRGFTHLLSVKNGANFSVPGSGKTTVVYAVFEKLRLEQAVEILLVIGPRSCFQPWEDEAKACISQDLNIVRLSGSKRFRQSIFLHAIDFQVLLCTYQTATNDKEEIIALCKKYSIFIVIDESHNIKSFEGGKWAETMLEIAQYATRRVILSGTPIPNNLTDLWSQMTFLWPGGQILGDRNSYRFRCEDEKEVRGIKEAVKPFIFRTTKAELGLPKPKFIYHYCDLNPYQDSIYQALSIKILQELGLEPVERMALREWRKAKIVRLIQAASNPALLARYSSEFNVPPIDGQGLSPVQLIKKYPQYEVPAKFQEAIKVTQDLLNQGQKVILWTTFVFNIQMLQLALKGVSTLIVYGAVPKDDSENIEFNREQQIKKFKESSAPVVLIANPAACAESISLCQ